jgi:hypothetical protein
MRDARNTLVVQSFGLATLEEGLAYNEGTFLYVGLWVPVRVRRCVVYCIQQAHNVAQWQALMNVIINILVS